MTCIACSIFRKEIEHLQAESGLGMQLRFLSSMLHMAPEVLEQRIQATVAEERALGHAVVLAYGDCCPDMTRIGSEKGIGRTAGCNCLEILLGREAFRKLRREGVFFLLPEWVLKWRSVFQVTLGLQGKTAQDFMKEMHTRLVYVDTGLVPVPETELAEVSAYFGLPVERMAVSMAPLLDSLRSAAPGISHE